MGEHKCPACGGNFKTMKELEEHIKKNYMVNPILKVIRDRRSVIRFETVPIEEKKIQSILEAGRWAPSWVNQQPWRFILITDPEIRAYQRTCDHHP